MMWRGDEEVYVLGVLDVAGNPQTHEVEPWHFTGSQSG